MQQCNCPNCGSSNTHRVSLLYQSGTSYARVWTQHGVGSASSRTALASRLAPPEPPSSHWVITLFLRLPAYGYALHKSAQWGFMMHSYLMKHGGTLDPGLAFGFFLVCMIGLWIAIEVAIYLMFLPSEAEHTKMLQNWLQQFLCMRCGARFIPQSTVGARTKV